MTEEQQQESGFSIGGEFYEIPSLYSFDMDENKIMYDISGTPAEDWIVMIESAKLDDLTPEMVEEIAARIQNPGFLRATVHIAYRRAHPDVKHDEIDVVVGKSNHVNNWAALFLPRESGDVEDPSQSGTTSEPARSSPNEPDESKPTNESLSGTPGSSLRKDSERPDATLAPTGTGESDTPSRRWGRIRSVA